MTNQNKIPAIKLCGCGNCNEAMDAALRFAEQNFHLKGDSCVLWNYSVATMLQHIATHQIVVDRMRIDAERDPDATEDRSIEIAMHTASGYDALVALGYYQNDELNNKVADFVEASVGYKPKEDVLRPGPNIETVEEGFHYTLDAERNGMINDALADFLTSKLPEDLKAGVVMNTEGKTPLADWLRDHLAEQEAMAEAAKSKAH